MLLPETHIQQLLEYYMGKNTIQRQEFIIDNLKIELDLVEEVEHDIEEAKAEAEEEAKADAKAGIKTKAKALAEAAF